jgi:hypothetical protein
MGCYPAWHRPYLLNISRHPYQGFSSSHLDTIAEKSDLASPGLLEQGADAPQGAPGHLEEVVKAGAEAVLHKVASPQTIVEEVRRLGGG